MSQLIVKTSKLPFILAGLLGIFFVPAGLWNLVRGILSGFKPVPVILGILLLVSFAGVLWLVLRGYSNSVKYFTDEGLKRNDGKQFAWADLSRVVNQIRFNPTLNRKMLWRTEIQFKEGTSAWLIPSKVANFQEVSEFVANLPCEHAEVKV